MKKSGIELRMRLWQYPIHKFYKCTLVLKMQMHLLNGIHEAIGYRGN